MSDLKHFIDIKQINSSDLKEVIKIATRLKKTPISESSLLLPDKNLAMIFEKNSTRTRVSFDSAIKNLGGNSIIMSNSDTQISKGEEISDTAKVLSSYVDIIMQRCNNHNTILEMAKYATVPVINGLTDKSHPCQIMASILTIIEKQGEIENKVLAWIGEPNNVLNSYIHAARKFNFTLHIAKPTNMTFSDQEIIAESDLGANIKVFENPEKAVMDADVVITDTWFSMGYVDDIKRQEKINILLPYQVNKKLMNIAKKNTIFTHCLPAYRGFEVTKDVIDSKQSVVFEEAENRLHVQKAIIYFLLKS